LLYFTTGRHFPPYNCPSQGGPEPSSNTWFIIPTQILNPNGNLIGSAVFAQLTSDFAYTLQWATPSPSKLPLYMEIWTPI